jgi:hypothetical protein
MARRWKKALAVALCTVALAALPSAAWSAGSAYVVNNISATGSQYELGAGGLLTPKTPATVAVSSKRRVSLRAKRFSIAAHGRKTVKLSLPKSLRKVLKGKHRLTLVITVRVKDPAGHTRTVTKRVTPKLKRTHRR